MVVPLGLEVFGVPACRGLSVGMRFGWHVGGMDGMLRGGSPPVCGSVPVLHALFLMSSVVGTVSSQPHHLSS